MIIFKKNYFCKNVEKGTVLKVVLDIAEGDATFRLFCVSILYEATFVHEY